MQNHFCTCGETKCKNHPNNHEKGCDPCIQKNLARGEIPACFYLKVSPDTSGLTSFTVDSFVNFYLQHNEGKND